MKIEIKNGELSQEFKPLEMGDKEILFAEEDSGGSIFIKTKNDLITRIGFNGVIGWNPSEKDYLVRNIKKIKTMTLELGD